MVRSAVPILRLGRARRCSADTINDFANGFDTPSLRDWPECGVREGIGEEFGGGGVHVGGLAAIGLGADGVEVHEPGLEERAGHLLQGLVHPSVQFDFGGKIKVHITNSFLHLSIRNRQEQLVEVSLLKMRNERSNVQVFNLRLHGR